MIDRLNHIVEHTDETLMHLLLGGDRNALMLLYTRYFDKLVWFARTFVFNQEQSEDIVQEVFIKLIEHPEQFNGSLKFSTWIYTITANRCKNHLRNAANRERLLQDVPNEKETISHSTYDYLQLRDKLKVFINTLNEKERTLFNLRFEHQLAVKEIAQLTTMPEGSVKSGIFYLLKKISLHIKDFTHD